MIPEAVRKIVARLFVEAVRVLVEAVIKIIQAVRLFVHRGCESACRGRESH